MKKTSITLCGVLLIFVAHAQIETAYLSSGNFTRVGAGLYTNIGFRVSPRNMITTDFEFVVFHQASITEPLAVGFRYRFNKDAGFYVEPQAGYSFIITGNAIDTSKSATGYSRGSTIPPDANGFLTAIATGYLFPGKLALNASIRYAHFFPLQGLPANIVSLRLTHTIICGRKSVRDRYSR